MIFQEWDWDKAKEIWQREAAAERDLAWEAVVADKDAEIARLRSQLNTSQ